MQKAISPRNDIFQTFFSSNDFNKLIPMKFLKTANDVCNQKTNHKSVKKIIFLCGIQYSIFAIIILVSTKRLSLPQKTADPI